MDQSMTGPAPLITTGRPMQSLETGLGKTVEWYLENQAILEAPQ